MNDEQQQSADRQEAARLHEYVSARTSGFDSRQLDDFTDYLVAIVIGFFADGKHLSDTFTRLVNIAAGEVEHQPADFGD